MKVTSPPHDQKLEFHRLRAEGKWPGGLEGWKQYQEWRSTRPPKPPRVVASNQPVEQEEEEPAATAQEDLGF